MEFVIENGILEKCNGNETDIAIPEGVEKIGYFCFDTPNMQRLTIPASLKNLDHFNPERLADLEEIIVAPENPNYLSVDGVLYNKEGTELLIYPFGAKRTEFTVPDTVMTIGKETFSRHRHLKTIDLRYTKTIGSGAFYLCTVERAIMNEVETIENSAFKWSHLKQLSIPSTLKSIGSDAFDCGIQECITIPKSVEFVSVDCFAEAKEISIYDNLRVQTFANYRWSWIGRIAKQFRLFVYSSKDDSLRYVVPLFTDGSYKMNEALRGAWEKEGCFDFQVIDSYFSNIKDFQCKIQTAITRLKWPMDLEEINREAYIKYLSRNAKRILIQCIDDSDVETFVFLRDLGLVKKNLVQELVEHAAEKDFTEITAVLLNEMGSLEVNSTGKKGLDNLDFDREMNKKEPKKKLSDKAKTLLFEKMVLTGSIEEIKNCFSEIGMIEMPARSLGMACRFRGLEVVKTLIQLGFDFCYTNTPAFRGKYDCGYTTAGFYQVASDYLLLILDNCDCQSSFGIHSGYKDRYSGKFIDEAFSSLTIISEDERAEIIEYLYQNKKEAWFQADKLLYYSILSQSDFAIRKLKSLGVTIPKQEKGYITEGGKGLDFEDYQKSLFRNDSDELKKQFEYWLDEINDGEKIVIFKTYAEKYADQLFSPEVYSVIKDRADFSRVNKKAIMEHFVDTDNSTALALLLNDNWANKRQLKEVLINRAEDKESVRALEVLNNSVSKTAVLVESRQESEKIQKQEKSGKNNEAQFAGKKVVTTGLTAADERWVQQEVESRGGEYKPKFVVSLDYLVYNPDYDHETVKLTKAREQIEKGKNVIIVTLDEFRKML